MYKSPTNIFEPRSNITQGTSSLSDAISGVRFLWSLAADTNNGRITLATETNRRTPEGSSGLYKNTSKKEINSSLFFRIARGTHISNITLQTVFCISTSLPSAWFVCTLWY
jgi:hypothetical protein